VLVHVQEILVVTNMLNLLILLGIGGIVAYIFSRLERRKRVAFIEDREEEELANIYAESFSKEDISYDSFLVIWIEISEILHVNPKKMKLNDLIKNYSTKSRISIFSDLDTFEEKLQLTYRINDNSTLKDLILHWNVIDNIN